EVRPYSFCALRVGGLRFRRAAVDCCDADRGGKRCCAGGRVLVDRQRRGHPLHQHEAAEQQVAEGRVRGARLRLQGGRPARQLRPWLANRVDGDLVLTIARYHAGLGSLAKFGYTVPPYAYTRQYLKMVLERYYQYKAEEQRGQAMR